MFELWVCVSENMVDIAPEQTCLRTDTLIKNVHLIPCDKDFSFSWQLLTCPARQSHCLLLLHNLLYMSMLFIMMMCVYQRKWFMQRHAKTLDLFTIQGLLWVMFMDCHSVPAMETLQEDNNKAGPFPVTVMKLWYLLHDCKRADSTSVQRHCDLWVLGSW